MKTLLFTILAVLICLLCVSIFNISQIKNDTENGFVGGGFSKVWRSMVINHDDATAAALKTRSGIFGSVIITKTGTAPLTFYAATTTNAALRADIATSSLSVVAAFPGSMTAGVYEYNTSFVDGLIYEFGSGTMASTTVTWD